MDDPTETPDVEIEDQVEYINPHELMFMLKELTERVRYLEREHARAVRNSYPSSATGTASTLIPQYPTTLGQQTYYAQTYTSGSASSGSASIGTAIAPQPIKTPKQDKRMRMKIEALLNLKNDAI